MDDNKRNTALMSQAGPVEDEDAAGGKSLGERLVPLLVTAMECCVLGALLLVMTGMLPFNSRPVIPIWTIFLVFFSLYGLSAGLGWLLDMYTENISIGLYRALATLVLVGGALVSMLFCLWLAFYAQSFALFDAAWLSALVYDAGQIDRDLQMGIMAFFLCLLAWLSYQAVQGKTNAALLLSKGTPLMLILAAVNLGEGLLRTSSDFWEIVLLLALFYWLGLAAQAFQKASVKRRQHLASGEESLRRQERIIVQGIVLLGLSMGIVALGAMLIHGGIVLYIPRTNPFETLPVGAKGPPDATGRPPVPRPIDSTGVLPSSPLWAIIILAFLVYLFWRILPKRRRKRRKKTDSDEKKSLWSWALFWSQCRALFWSQCRALLLVFLALFKRWLRRSDSKEAANRDDFWQAPPEIRSVREFYQAFLRKATRQGYPRQQDETPYEFRQRLYTLKPLLEPELETLTNAYTLARYGGCIPREDEIMRVNVAWHVLNNKWPEEGNEDR